MAVQIYLKTHKIEQRLQSLLDELVAERPAEPFAFMVRALQQPQAADASGAPPSWEFAPSVGKGGSADASPAGEWAGGAPAAAVKAEDSDFLVPLMGGGGEAAAAEPEAAEGEPAAPAPAKKKGGGDDDDKAAKKAAKAAAKEKAALEKRVAALAAEVSALKKAAAAAVGGSAAAAGVVYKEKIVYKEKVVEKVVYKDRVVAGASSAGPSKAAAQPFVHDEHHGGELSKDAKASIGNDASRQYTYVTVMRS